MPPTSACTRLRSDIQPNSTLSVAYIAEAHRTNSKIPSGYTLKGVRRMAGVALVRRVCLCLLVSLFPLIGYGETPRSGSESWGAEIAAPSTQDASTPQTKAAPQPADAGLPVDFERHTGDLDAMVKRGNIRALVLYSHTGFFYVNGRPQGIYYEALHAFEQFVNQ